MKDWILYISLLILMGVAAFEAGIIYENRRHNDLVQKVYKNSDHIRELTGKVEALEALDRRAKMPKKPGP
jgi:hypothetical protein